MDCENVQIVINQSNELYGTLLYHQGRFTLVTLPDLDLAQKSKTALKAMFREGLSDTIELAAKGAIKAIASAIAKNYGVRVPPNALPMNFREYYETIKYYYRNNTYDYACVLWELPFPMMISVSLWGTIVKIVFDDDVYGYATCNLRFPSQTVAKHWNEMINERLNRPALPEGTS